MIDENQDVRWIQRFANFQKTFDQLKKFIDKGELSELEEQGLIKAFEYTFELAWTTLKDFLEYRGQRDIYGPRDAIRKAFQLNLIDDGENWMDMLASRNRTSHSYNKETAEEICHAVKSVYFSFFQKFENKMEKLKTNSDKA
ncbi:MAG: nucleotidyltransferase substrate binding protein [Deltaproteobacteria bacterium]|nr:nucleotidyltransferase substrate binding protein [Deltaproteobacteria bacterium]